MPPTLEFFLYECPPTWESWLRRGTCGGGYVVVFVDVDVIVIVFVVVFVVVDVVFVVVDVVFVFFNCFRCCFC